MAENHRLPNELVYELCANIPTFEVPERVLLTAGSIHVYLEQRYRRKLVYRDVICFIKAKLYCENKVLIKIGRGTRKEGDQHVVTNQRQLDGKFELRTNQLCIRAGSHNFADKICQIDGDEFDNVHVYFFVRLLAPLVRPLSFSLLSMDGGSAAFDRLMDSLNNCVDLFRIQANQLLLEPICGALDKCNRLHIYFHADLGDVQKLQFRCALTRWLNAGNRGQPKQCEFAFNFEDNELAPLLDEIEADFSRATTRRRFAVRLSVVHSADEEPTALGLSVRNSVGERLELRHSAADNRIHYTLIRHTNAELAHNNGLDVDFDTHRMARIHFR